VRDAAPLHTVLILLHVEVPIPRPFLCHPSTLTLCLNPRHESVSAKTYADVYRDLRTAVDMCHRDGSLKKAVASNPGACPVALD
jgi:hypothetical protein